MFGSSPAKKLSKCYEQARKAYAASQQEAFEQQVSAALELIRKHENEAAIEFLAAMQMLALLLLQAGRSGQGLSMLREILDRAERLNQDRTAFYAMACQSYAWLIRLNLRDYQAEGRELLGKGLRRALEGDKKELFHLVEFIEKYLDELKAYKLADWIPGLLRQAREVYESKAGANSMATGATLVQFAAALMDTDLTQEKPLALEAANRAHQILLENKAGEDELAVAVLLKARLLQETGRIDQAAELLRETAGQVKGQFLAAVIMALAQVELGRGQEPRTVESLVQRGLEAAQGPEMADARVGLLGIKGFCAGLRGDEQAVAQAVLQLEATLANVPKPEANDDGEENDTCEAERALVDQLEFVARGLYLGGFHQAALKVSDRALKHAEKLKAQYPEELQEALVRKALILSRLGRHQESEALLIDQVLERLDDINQLDTRRHAEALIDLGDAWIEQGDYDRAREALKSAWAMSAEHDGKESEMAGHIYVMMGRLFMRINQAAQAKVVLRRGREALLAHGAFGFRARMICEEYKRLQAGTA